MCSTALALVFPALCDIALRTCPVEEGRLQSRSTTGQAFRFFMDGFTLILALTGFLTGMLLILTHTFFLYHISVTIKFN